MTNKEFIKSVSLEGEEWRDVVGYEGLYMVSSHGRVASLEKDVTRVRTGRETHTICVHQKLLSPWSASGGYLYVSLSRDGKKRNKIVHRLVMEAFVPNELGCSDVDHIDTNKQNNHVTNLRWCSRAGNMQNPKTKSLLSDTRKGRIFNDNRRKVVQLKNGEVVMVYNSIIDVKQYGFCQSSVERCLYGRHTQHKGFNWMYFSDYETYINKSKST